METLLLVFEKRRSVNISLLEHVAKFVFSRHEYIFENELELAILIFSIRLLNRTVAVCYGIVLLI